MCCLGLIIRCLLSIKRLVGVMNILYQTLGQKYHSKFEGNDEAHVIVGFNPKHDDSYKRQKLYTELSAFRMSRQLCNDSRKITSFLVGTTLPQNAETVSLPNIVSDVTDSTVWLMISSCHLWIHLTPIVLSYRKHYKIQNTETENFYVYIAKSRT